MRFSFITCTYNRETYIGQTLQAACRQIFPKDDFEHIIVDNNSTDDTAKVCKQHIAEYQNIQIRYVSEINQGLSHALNRGIAEAKGEYLIFLDDDETISPTHLQKLAVYLDEFPQAQFIGTPVIPVYETQKPKWLSHFTMRLITGQFNKGDHVRLLTTKEYPGTGHTIIKRELYERFGTYNTDLGRKGGSLIGAEDKDMSFRLIENEIECYYFPGIPIYHHIPDSKLTDDFFEQLTYSIGKSEYTRTRAISKQAYRKRLVSEAIKWCASIALCVGYTLTLQPAKGWKLIRFRYNVTRGLLGK